MARNFDGTDDKVDFGSDASVDGFTAFTVLGWVNVQTPGSNSDFWVNKNGGADQGWQTSFNTFTNVCDFYRVFSTTPGAWTWPKPANGIHHVAITYDGALTTNNPAATIDGTAQTVTTGTTPVGTVTSDAAHSLLLGEHGVGSQDFQGAISHLCYVSGVLDAAAINRHRWWGRPHGGIAVIQPMVTDKLTNEGTATATGTATGSAMASMVTPVQRPGMGTGW